jgi:hypothetical protein
MLGPGEDDDEGDERWPLFVGNGPTAGRSASDLASPAIVRPALVSEQRARARRSDYYDTPTLSPVIECLSCHRDRVLVGGRCVSEAVCNGNKIKVSKSKAARFPWWREMPCSCDDSNCQKCRKLPAGDVCQICRNGLFLLGGSCVEKCPAALASSGIRQWRRQCLEPFECAMRKRPADEGEVVGQAVKYGCTCPDANCAACRFEPGGAGHTCVRCRFKSFLYGGACHESCEAVIAADPFLQNSDLFAYVPGATGRSCRAKSFVCNVGKEVGVADDGGQAADCGCHNSVGPSGSCVSCTVTVDGQRCTRCSKYQYLHVQLGKCVTKCPNWTSEFVESQWSDQGRECRNN